MAGEEEILFNVNGNVSNAVSSLNEWVSAIQGVQRAFGELSTAIGDLSSAFSGLTQSIDGVMSSLEELAASPAAEMLTTLVEASTALEEAGSGVAQTVGEEAAALQELGDAATMAAEALTSTAPSAEELDAMLTTMTDGIGTVVTELSNMGGAGDGAIQAMLDLAQAVGDADAIMTAFGGEADTIAVAMDTIAPAMQAAQSALVGLGEAGAPAQAAMAQMVNQLNQITAATDPTSAALSQLSTMALDNASAMDTSSQAVAANASTINAGGAEIAAASGDIETVTQAFFAVGPAAQNAATLVQGAAQVVNNVQTAFQNATTGTTDFEAALNALLAKLDEVVGAVDTLTTAVATNSEEDAVAQERMGGDAMQLMMLIPMITQAAGGFVQMGLAAEDSIAHITGLADQSLALASNSKTLNTDINALQQSAIKYGVSLKDAADGLYYIISAGFNTADSLKILNVSMETSAATGTKMQDVSNALTSVLHAYALSADQAKNVQDQLTEAVVSGKQNYEEFAKVIGRTAAVGSNAGVSLKELLAAESELTQINPSVRQDTQNLANLMAVLSTGADKTAKTAASMGIKFEETSYRSKDLYEKLQYLQQVTGGNTDKMRALLQNATAFNAAENLLRDNGTLFANQMLAQGQAIGSTDRAFAQASQTITFAMNQISAAISVMSYNVIHAISPVVAPIFAKVGEVIASVAGDVHVLMPLMAGLATVLGVVLVGAISAVAGEFIGILTPIFAIGLALGALAAAAVAIGAKLKQMYDSATPVGAMLRDMVATVMSTAMTLRDALGGALTALHPLILGVSNILHSTLLPALASLAGGIGYGVAQLFNMITSAVKAATPYILQFGQYVQQHVAPALHAALPAIQQFAMTFGKMIPFILAIGGPLLALRSGIGLVSGAFKILEPAVAMAGQAFNLFKIPAAGIDFIMNALRFSILHPIQSFTQISAVIRNVGSMIAGQFKFAWMWLVDAFEMAGTFIAGAGGPLQAFLAICQGAGAAIGSFAGELIAMINPVTVIAAILVALTAILIHWLVTTKQGQAVLAGLWAALVQVGQVIMASLAPAWASLQASMRLIMASFQQVWVALQPLMPLFLRVAQILGGILVVSIAVVIAAIVGIITAFANWVAGMVNVIAHIIQFVTGVIQLFAGFFTIIKGMLHGNTAEMSQGWSTFCQGLQNMWNGLWGAIVGIAKTFIGVIKGLVGGFASAISGMFHAMADAVVHHSIWPDMWTAISANTSTNTAKVHGQVQNFSTQTQASFMQMQVASVAHVATMWQNVQRQITVAMTTSTAAVRAGFSAMNVQIINSGTLIQHSVVQTWALVAKSITVSLALIETHVLTCFATIDADIAKYDVLIINENNATWTAIAQQTAQSLNVMQNEISTGYANIAKTIQTDLNSITLQNLTFWTRLIQDTRTYWTLVISLYTQYELLIYNNYKIWQTNLTVLYTQWWTTFQTFLKAQLLLVTTAWIVFWKALILLDQNNWKLMLLDWTTGFKNLNVAIQAGIKVIETTITTLITWITQQMTTLDKNATVWGRDFAANFAAGINSGAGQIRSAIAGATSIAQANMGHSKPSQGPMRDDDVWGLHFIQNFARGIQQGLPEVQQAAQNAASIITAAMPTAQNALAASRPGQGNVTNGAEHLQVLKQILNQLKAMQGGGTGAVNNYGSTQIGYNIPSTQLGSIIQQFSGGNNQLSASQIANIYNQINQLQGLSQEYAARGASTGVGF